MSNTTSHKGIDYGNGRVNRNTKTGLRYGVIPANDVGQAWYDDAEAYYGDAHCPKCGRAIKPSDEIEDADKDYHCGDCEQSFWSEQCFGDEPQSFDYDREGYKATQNGSDCDIFVIESPYFTYAQFCSPCAPGACYLRNPLIEPKEATGYGKMALAELESNRAYCFGHDWFEDGVAPYPVYSVATGELVQPTAAA